MIDIAQWAESKYGFYVDRHWRGGRWVLKRGPIKLADYHARLLRHVFTPDGDGRLPYDTVAFCEPAKSGKSAIAGLCAEYIALHGDGDVYMASNKKNQAASIMYRSLTDSVEFSPFLHLQPTKFELEFRSGNVVRAIPSNARTEAGARFSLAVFDELAGYRYEDSTRLWSEFKTDPTRQSSLKLAVGFAGYHDSTLWRSLLDRGLAGEPVPELSDIEDGEGRPAAWRNGRHFTFWSHLCRQPWQTPAWIASQAASLLPSEFRRMIRTEFVSASQQAFVSPESWERCLSRFVRPIQAGDRAALVLALDLARGAEGGDCCALVGVSRWGPDGYGVRYAKKWDPPTQGNFDFRPIEHAISWLAQNANPQLLAYDPFQAVHLVGTNRQAWKVQTAKFEQGRDRYLSDALLYDLILGGKIFHDGDESLTRHVLNAGAKVNEDGKMRICKTTASAKNDLAVALGMGCFWLNRLRPPQDPGYVEEDRTMKLDILVSEPTPQQQVEVQPAALATKLAAIGDRPNVVLVYIGQRRATWSLNLRPTKRTLFLSTGRPDIVLSNAEARWLVGHPLGAEFEVLYE